MATPYSRNGVTREELLLNVKFQPAYFGGRALAIWPLDTPANTPKCYIIYINFLACFPRLPPSV